MSAGGRANRRGRTLEKAIVDLLAEDYTKVSARHFLALRSSQFALHPSQQPIYAEQCPIGKDIYGKNRRVDFILYHPEKWPDCLIIQCKWQASGGTVDQKYPFEVLSIQSNEFATIIVLDGGGYSEAAEKWLKGQVDKNKLLHVLSLGEICQFQSKGKI